MTIALRNHAELEVPKQTFLSVYQLVEGNGTPLQYTCLENPMDGGAWWATVCGVAKSLMQPSDFTFPYL